VTLFSFAVIQADSRALEDGMCKAGPVLAGQGVARRGGARQGLFELWNRSKFIAW